MLLLQAFTRYQLPLEVVLEQQYYMNIFVILCTYKSFQYFRIWHALQHNCQRNKWQTVPQCYICEVLQRILLKSNQNRKNNFVAATNVSNVFADEI